MSLKIGLALGSGAARGWAHIGVIRALQKYGIEPDIELAKYAELSFRSGLIDKERLNEGFVNNICSEGSKIESLDKAFGCVATDLHSGREVWFTQGDTLMAIWASIALPGLFAPVFFEDKWLVDGGLVNPVPVSMCRSLGADVVIAVDLNADIVGKHSRKAEDDSHRSSTMKKLIKDKYKMDASKEAEMTLGNWRDTVVDYSAQLFPNLQKEQAPQMPGMFETIAGSVNIMQDRITRSRMAGDPPDVLISPRLAHISLLEFYRAEETIQVGYDLTLQKLDSIRHAISN